MESVIAVVRFTTDLFPRPTLFRLRSQKAVAQDEWELALLADELSAAQEARSLDDTEHR